MWCPKCDMDFIDGVTVCTDCGGQLVNKEEWLAEQAEIEAAAAAEEEAKAAELREQLDNLSEEEIADIEERKQAFREMMAEPSVYEDARDKYDNNKSSATAFLVVGILLGVFAVVLWTNIVNLGTIAKIGITVFAAACLIVSVLTFKKAQKLKASVSEEENRFKSILASFTESHSADEIDGKISDKTLGPEEIALERLNIIQDMLSIDNVIEDKTLAATIAEDVYTKLFEE